MTQMIPILREPLNMKNILFFMYNLVHKLLYMYPQLILLKFFYGQIV